MEKKQNNTSGHYNEMLPVIDKYGRKELIAHLVDPEKLRDMLARFHVHIYTPMPLSLQGWKSSDMCVCVCVCMTICTKYRIRILTLGISKLLFLVVPKF